jgi:hypothetical protein
MVALLGIRIGDAMHPGPGVAAAEGNAEQHVDPEDPPGAHRTFGGEATDESQTPMAHLEAFADSPAERSAVGGADIVNRMELVMNATTMQITAERSFSHGRRRIRRAVAPPASRVENEGATNGKPATERSSASGVGETSAPRCATRERPPPLLDSDTSDEEEEQSDISISGVADDRLSFAEVLRAETTSCKNQVAQGVGERLSLRGVVAMAASSRRKVGDLATCQHRLARKERV